MVAEFYLGQAGISLGHPIMMKKLPTVPEKFLKV